MAVVKTYVVPGRVFPRLDLNRQVLAADRAKKGRQNPPIQSAIGITAPTETGSASVVKTFPSNSLINNERTPAKAANPERRVRSSLAQQE